MLCARSALDQLADDLGRCAAALAALAEQHRQTIMVGRTLTQHAVPITFGLKAAGWLDGVLDALDGIVLARKGLRVQCGGAAGTLAAIAELAGDHGLDWSAALAGELSLAPSTPWHTRRTPVTAVGDTLVTSTDALGHLASDIVVLSRSEIAEVSEPAGKDRGGSSTMPQKRNPVLAVLIRRAAATAPLLGSQLHLASAQAVDERPDGAWHTEWQSLALLARHAVTAASQAAELVEGLEVHADDDGRHRAAGDARSAGRTGVHPGLDRPTEPMRAMHRTTSARRSRSSTPRWTEPSGLERSDDPRPDGHPAHRAGRRAPAARRRPLDRYVGDRSLVLVRGAAGRDDSTWSAGTCPGTAAVRPPMSPSPWPIWPRLSSTHRRQDRSFDRLRTRFFGLRAVLLCRGFRRRSGRAATLARRAGPDRRGRDHLVRGQDRRRRGMDRAGRPGPRGRHPRPGRGLGAALVRAGISGPRPGDRHRAAAFAAGCGSVRLRGRLRGAGHLRRPGSARRDQAAGARRHR